MQTCTYCGRENAEESTHCKECGTQLPFGLLQQSESLSAAQERPPRFQTDRQLWFKIALGLFLGSSCFPLIGMKGESVRPVVWLWEVLRAMFDSSTTFRELFGMSTLLFIYAGLFGVASIVAAWIVQCVVVIVRTKKKERLNHAA